MNKKLVLLTILMFLVSALYYLDRGYAAQNDIDAIIISNTVPSVMATGEEYPVSITVKNTGNKTWSEADLFRLGGVDDEDPFALARQYISANTLVKTGETITFHFVMKAPSKKGGYITDWRMVQDNVTWFGETLKKTITVSEPYRGATIVSNTIPEQMIINKTYNVSIGIRNDSNIAWSEKKSYRLGAVNDSDPFAEGRFIIPNERTILPGEAYTFTFNMHASAAGTYLTDWSMLQENVTWFGNILSKYVTVIDPSKTSHSFYDKNNKLTSMIISSKYRLYYQYDGNGNLLKRTKSMNLLSNPGFEDHNTDWTIHPSMWVTNEKPRNGLNSVKYYTNEALQYGISSNSTYIPVIPNTSYILSGYLLDNLTYGGFYIDWMEFDQSNQLILDGAGIVSAKRGTGDWNKGTITFTTQAQTSSIVIRVVADSGAVGEGFVDDIELSKM